MRHLPLRLLVSNCIKVLISIATAIEFSEQGALAADLGEVTQNSVSAAVSENKNAVTLTIAGSGALDPDVFALTDPTRVVIDLPGVKIQKNNTLTVAQNHLVTAVRLGCHLDKTRIVVDLVGTKKPRIGHGINAGKLLVSIEFDSDITQLSAQGSVTASPKVPTTTVPPEVTAASKVTITKVTNPTATPIPPKTNLAAPIKPAVKIGVPDSSIPAPVTTPSSENKLKDGLSGGKASAPQGFPSITPTTAAVQDKLVVTVVPTSAAPQKTPQPRVTLAPVATVEPPRESNKKVGTTPDIHSTLDQNSKSAAATTAPIDTVTKDQNLLSGISFDYEEDTHGPIITVSLTQRPRYTLTKASDRSYRLVVPDVNLAGEHLSLPLFPPEDFNGFTVIRAQQVGPNVELLIGIERGNKVTPIVRDSQIIIKGAPKLALRP